METPGCNIDGVTCFVIVDTYFRATVDGAEIGRSVVEVALQTVNIERILSGADRNGSHQLRRTRKS